MILSGRITLLSGAHSSLQVCTWDLCVSCLPVRFVRVLPATVVRRRHSVCILVTPRCPLLHRYGRHQKAQREHECR